MSSKVESVWRGVTGVVKRGRQRCKHDVNTVFMNKILKTLNYIRENGDFSIKMTRIIDFATIIFTD